MAKRDINSLWDRDMRKAIDKNFDELYDIRKLAIDEAISDIKPDVIKEAALKWQEPVDTVDDIDNIKTPQDGFTVMERKNGGVYRYNGSDWEKIQEIDVGPVNEVDNRLSNELRNISKEVTSRLDEKSIEIDMKTTFARYGKTKLPEDFPRKNIPFEIYRDFDGLMKHTADLDKFEENAGHIHIKGYTGSDSNDGITPDKPVRLLNDAISKANALPDDTVVLHFYDDSLDMSRTGGDYTYTLKKNLIFKSESPKDKTIYHTGFRMAGTTWTKEGNAYYAPVTRNSREMYDVQNTHYRGLPKKLIEASSVQEVKDTPNSFYVDTEESRTWIRAFDDREIDPDILWIEKPSYQLKFSLEGNRLVFRDMGFIFRGNNNALMVAGEGGLTENGEFWHEGCIFGSATKNGLSTTGVKSVYGFNSLAYNIDYDGFNYHAPSKEDGKEEFVFEYFCEAFNCGHEGDSTMNATTAHEGMTLLRVGSIGYDTYGPVLADVNGCYSVCIDCTMYDSLRSTYKTRAGFYFDEAGAIKDGKAYLINCGGGGVETWTFNTDGEVDLFLQNIKGNNIPNDIDFTIIE